MAAQTFDTLVIGSGIGGLTCASLLTQLAGERVLVLERHFTPGGFTHAFRRPGGFSWDVGVHYVGQMQAGGMFAKHFDLLCGAPLDWNKMPDPFERFVYPELEFGVYANPRRYQEDLAALFPAERDALARYFRDIDRVARWLGLGGTLTALAPGQRLASLTRQLATVLGKRKALATTKQVLDGLFADPKLKALLVSQWGTHGLPPARSAFAAHALIVSHYLRGGYYPDGGAGRIAELVSAVLARTGGEIRVNHHVDEILLEGQRAIGVRGRIVRGAREEPFELRARRVVSDAGADTTYRRLLPPERVPRRIRDDLAALPAGAAHVNLYLGLDRSLEDLGIRGENLWLFRGYDHDAMATHGEALLAGEPAFGYASFPSAKDTQAEGHTAEMLTMADYGSFERWASAPWRRRGAEYEALKTRITAGLMAMLEQRVPGLSERVVQSELSTPVTTEGFTGHRGGCIYGLPATPERYGLPWLGVETPLDQLYLTGADAFLHGLVGAMMGGVLTAAKLLGGLRGFGKIMSAANRV